MGLQTVEVVDSDLAKERDGITCGMCPVFFGVSKMADTHLVF